MDEFNRLLFGLPERRVCSICEQPTFEYVFFNLSIDEEGKLKPPVRETVLELMTLCPRCKERMWITHLYAEYEPDILTDAQALAVAGADRGLVWEKVSGPF